METIAQAAQRLTSTKTDQAELAQGRAKAPSTAPAHTAAAPAPRMLMRGMVRAPREAAEFHRYQAAVRAAFALHDSGDGQRTDDLAHVLWRACAAIRDLAQRRQRRHQMLEAVRSLIATDPRAATPEPRPATALGGRAVDDEPTDQPAARPAEGPAGEGNTEPFWRTRLTFETSDPAGSPLVRGTMIRAHEVAALVRTGWTWRELLDRYPELDDDDLRACLCYALMNDESDQSDSESPGRPGCLT